MTIMIVKMYFIVRHIRYVDRYGLCWQGSVMNFLQELDTKQDEVINKFFCVIVIDIHLAENSCFSHSNKAH
jgi:hypothetical protein